MIKSKIINTFVPLLLLPFFILACGESDNIEPKDENIDSVTEFLTNDNGLRITLLTDDEDNETYLFLTAGPSGNSPNRSQIWN
jgi:hypothetical protein